MSKKRINKTKIKQKQKQKQMQIVNVNIHKPTRKPREGPTQRRNVQQLPTPQYIYTSQVDSLVPQMFNKEGKQQSIPTLSEQINKSLDEKINKLVSQYTKPATQPTQEEVRKTRTESYKPVTKMTTKYTINKTAQKQPIILQKEPENILSNIQTEQPIKNAPTEYMKQNEPENIYAYNAPEQRSLTTEDIQPNTGYSLIKQPQQRSTSVINKERYKTPTREEIRNLRIPNITYKLPDEFIKQPAVPLVPDSTETTIKPEGNPIKDLTSQQLIDYKKEIKKRITNNETKRETPGLNKQGKGHITRLINKDKQKIVEINNEINTRSDIQRIKK